MNYDYHIRLYKERPEFHQIDVALAQNEAFPWIGILQPNQLAATIDAIRRERIEVTEAVSFITSHTDHALPFHHKIQGIIERYKLYKNRTKTLLAKMDSIALHYCLIERSLREDLRRIQDKHSSLYKPQEIENQENGFQRASPHVLLHQLLTGHEITITFLAEISQFVNVPTLSPSEITKSELIFHLFNTIMADDIRKEHLAAQLDKKLKAHLKTGRPLESIQQEVQSIEQKIAQLSNERDLIFSTLEELVQSRQHLLQKEEPPARDDEMDELTEEAKRFRNQGQPTREELESFLSTKINELKKRLLEIFSTIHGYNLVKNALAS